MYQSVEVKYKNANNNTILYWDGVLQGLSGSFYVSFIYISDWSKTIHGKYTQMLLANDTDWYLPILNSKILKNVMKYNFNP